jgi:hypothetical protein
MNDEPHPLNLQSTLDRMEEGVSTPAIEQSLASIAISMKRIADAMTEARVEVQRYEDPLHRDLQELISAVRNNHQRVFIAERT